MNEPARLASFCFDPETLELLARLAAVRAKRDGGSPNKSATLRELVRREAREALEAAKQNA